MIGSKEVGKGLL